MSYSYYIEDGYVEQNYFQRIVDSGTITSPGVTSSNDEYYLSSSSEGSGGQVIAVATITTELTLSDERYYNEGYIAENYFAVTRQAELSAFGNASLSCELTDVSNYIDNGYVTDGYYGSIQYAQANLSMFNSVGIETIENIGDYFDNGYITDGYIIEENIVEFAADITATFTIAFDGYDFIGFTSTPNSTFSISADVEKIVELGLGTNNVEEINNLETQTTLAVDILRILPYDATFSSSFTQSNVDGKRIRFIDAISLDNSITLSTTVLQIVQFDATLASQFDIGIDYRVYVPFTTTPNSTFTTTCDANRIFELGFGANNTNTIEDASVDLDSEATVTTAIAVQREASATIESEATTTSTALRIKDFDVDIGALFTPGVTANALKNHDAILDSTTDLSATISKFSGNEATLDNIINISLQADRFADYNASLSTSSSVTSSATQTHRPTISLTAQSTITCQASVANILAPITLEVKAATVRTIVTIKFRSTEMLVYGSPTYNEFRPLDINNSEYKFGTGSLSYTKYAQANITYIHPTYPPVYDGTDFYLFTPGYTFVSSDGNAWTRYNNNLSIVNEVEYINGTFVTFGSGTIAYSTNGTTWNTTSPGSITTGIGYVNGYWVYAWQDTANKTLRIYSSSTINGTYTQRQTYTYTNSIAIASNWYMNSNYTSIELLFNDFQGSGTVGDSNGNYPIWDLKRINSTNGTSFGISTDINDASRGRRYVGIVNGVRVTYDQQNNYYTYRNSSTTTEHPLRYSGSHYYYRNLASTTIGNFSDAGLTPYDSDSYITTGGNTSVLFANRKGVVRTATTFGDWSDYKVINSTANNAAFAEIKPSPGSSFDEANTIDFWIKIPTTSSSDRHTFLKLEGWDSNNVNPVTLYRFGWVSDDLVFEESGSNKVTVTNFGYDTWKHVRVVRSGTSGALYVDGVRQSTFTWDNTYSSDYALRKQPFQWAITGQYSISYYMDELRLTKDVVTSPSVSSFSVPTSEETNDTDTLFLGHFNSNFDDVADYNDLVVPQATLSSAFTVEASLSYTATATITPPLNATLECNAGVIEQFDANLDVQSTVIADNTRLKLYQADIDAIATVNSQPVKQTEVIAPLDAVVTITPNVGRFRDLEITTESIATSLFAVAKIGDFLITTETRATVDATITKTNGAVATLNAPTTLTAANERIRAVSATLTGEFTQTSQEDYFVGFVATANATTTQVTEGNRTADFVAVISDAVSFAIEVTATRNNEILMPTTASIITDADVTRSGVATLTSTTAFQPFTTVKVDAAAQLNTIATTSVTAKALRIETFEYVIPAEDREYEIVAETREATVT